MKWDPARKTALWVGGAAVATGVALLLWPKSSALQPRGGGSIPISAGGGWFPMTGGLVPGGIYEMAFLIPPNSAVSDFEAEFQGAQFLHPTVMYWPGQFPWPAELATTPLDQNRVAVLAFQWHGPGQPVFPEAVAALQWRELPISRG